MLEDHITEFHQHDEEVRTALWGRMRSWVEGGGRRTEEGLVHRVEQLERAKGTVKLAASDKVIITAILAVLEFIRWING